MQFAATLALAALMGPESPPSPIATAVEARVTVSGADLSITLTVPAGNRALGRVPAALILPGSGCSTRKDSQAFAEAFLRVGIAVLAFDKRGCGASTGSWLRTSLDDMAADSRTLFDWLRARPEIDPSRVGLVGVSQGGWVAPLVASSRPDTAFLIGLTGGGVSPRAIETFDYDRRLERAQITGAELTKARKAIGSYFDYLAGQAPMSEIVGLLEAGKTQPWHGVLGLNRVLPDESFRAAWAWVPTFDPHPSLISLRLPVLALIGGMDRDPAVEVKAWQAGLSKNGDPRSEIRVVPNSGHVLSVGDSHMRGSFNTQALDAMATWAASTVRR